jgi:hypothetical protein
MATSTFTTAVAQKKSTIRWKRVLIAGFLSEVAVMAVMSTIMAVRAFVISPALTAAELGEFGELTGYYVAAPAAALATFLFAFWAVRRLDSGFVANGLLVGIAATLLSVGFIVTARPEHRWMYVLSFLLRITAGYWGGVVGQYVKGASRNDHARQVR